MTADEVADIVTYMAAAFGRTDISRSDVTYAAWADQLGDVDPEVGLGAARRVVNQDDRFPTVARFLDVAEEEAALVIQRRREEDALALPPPDTAASTEAEAVPGYYAPLAAAYTAALRSAMTSGLRPSDECAAQDPATVQLLPGCPWCDAIVSLRDDHLATRPTTVVPTTPASRCGFCDGSGMRPHGNEGHLRPCEGCNRDSYELWAGGHYALNHNCEECRARRRNKGRPVRADK